MGKGIATRVVVGAFTALGLSACCVGGGGHKAAGEHVKSTGMVKADPSMIKQIHKVAVVSIYGPCDIEDKTGEKHGGGVFGAVYGAQTVKNADATRIPMSLDQGARAMVQQLAANSGLQVMGIDDVINNPKYTELTFDADLHKEVAETRQAWCTGDKFRVLPSGYTPRAGELAAALGVDAVILIETEMHIDKWLDQNGQPGIGLYSVATDANMWVVGPDGKTLWTDSVQDVRQDKWVGADDEHHAAVAVIEGVDWKKVPHNAVNTLSNAGARLGQDLKKATTGST